MGNGIIPLNQAIKDELYIYSYLVLAFAETDTDEFKRQSQAFKTAWEASGFTVICFEVPRRNHFNVILDWQYPDSSMTLSTLSLFKEIARDRKHSSGGAV